MRVLVVNVGSSSVKLVVLDGDTVVTAEQRDVPSDGTVTALDELGDLDRLLHGVDAVGHRVVHGGPTFDGPVVVDRAVRAQLEALVSLAPLHQPAALQALDRLQEALPDVPHVACFDTAFHATLPEAARTWALPAAWRDQGVRRYGFHGLSHAHVARRAAELVGRAPEGLRIVSCHLGSGASLCAIVDGRSIDTTMGLTPVDGLVMASRPGSVDPGALAWLVAERGVGGAELADGLEHRSGLVALAGTRDLRAVLDRADAGEEAAVLALEVYHRSLRAHLAAMVASLGGIDVVSFTGGVGERAPRVRARVAADLAFLGLAVDGATNEATTADGIISPPAANVAAVVVTAREDLEVARQVRRLLR